jgi:hypothetical protein
VHVVDINGVDERPPVLRDVVQVVDPSGCGIAVRGVVDGPPAHVNGLLHRQVVAPVVVQNSVRQQASAPNRKVLALEAGPLVVHVVELGSGLVPAGDHGPHAEAVPAVAAHDVGQELGGGRHGDASAVPELVQATLHPQVPLPEGAVGRPAGHGPEQERVDPDDLLDGPAGNVRAHGGPRVDRHDDPAVELEGEGGGPLGELDRLVLVSRAAHGAEVGPAVRRGLREKTNEIAESGTAGVS